MLTDRIHHVGFAVNDLEGALKWYREKLGFQLEKRFELEDARVAIVKLRNEAGVGIELLKSLDRDNRPVDATQIVNPGVRHLCFDVEDIESAAAELTRRGVRVMQPPKTIPESGEKNMWVADVEGNPIEFIENIH